MKTKTFTAQVLLILYLAAVVYICFGHLENTALPIRSLFGIDTDKIVHGLMFLPFSILVYHSFGSRSTNVFESLGIAAGLFIIGACVAASTEYFQGFTHYRTSDIRDFYADCIGLGAGSFAVLVSDIAGLRKKRSKK